MLCSDSGGFAPSLKANEEAVEAFHAGEGRYSGITQLAMGGTWEVAISVREGGKALAARRTSIVAKE